MLTVPGVMYKGTAALPQHTMKTSKGIAEYLHTFLSSGERLGSCPGHFSYEKKRPWYPLGGFLGWSGCCGEK
jgi:hypothetical protein